MHDVGNVMVLRAVQSRHGLAGGIDLPTFEYLCAVCHQEFGELIAANWRLPDQMKSLLANHHTFPEPDDPLRTERLMLILSDMIGSMLGHGPSASYDLMATRPVQELGLADRANFKSWLGDLPAQINDAMIYF
jgi:HD-like signal output (HDOD) protein